jgi:hypothetical protein
MPPRRLFAALAILVLLFASSSAWADTTYYVEVVLTDAETGNPASGARVLFSDDRGLGMRNPEAIEHGGKPGFYYGSVPLYDNEKQITYRVTVTCQGYEDRIHFLTITRGTPTTPSQSLPLKLGAWGYWWYTDQKPMQTTGDTMSFTLPEKGAEVLVKLVKATSTAGRAQELKWTTKTIRAMPMGRISTGDR